LSDRDPDKPGEPAPPSDGEGRPDDGARTGPPVPPPSTWAGREWTPGGDEPEDGDAAPPGPADASEVVEGDLADELDEPPEFEGEELDRDEISEREEPGEDELDEDGDGEELEEDELEDQEVDGDELEAELDGDELADEALAQELGGGDGAGAHVDEDTVEADTPTLADREAAREAALAGLRARAAEHAAKQGTGVTAVGERPATAEAKAVAKAEEAPPAEAAPPAPEPSEEKERPPKRSLWPRFVAGSLVIIVAMTTATAVSLLVYLKDIARGLGGLPSVQSQLAAVNPGDPQTILILGSDRRPAGQEIGARSDTTILLRVATNQITVLSIPRDLKVNIPGHGIDRFNAAYSYGGPKLTLKVVKQLTGLDNINHVVNVDFTGFADAVNAIDCVYVDVDHHYYHSNVGLAPSEQYAEIDVPAGYQRMCGYNALQYVRYRHDDNDLVRSARQQEFLRDARQQVPAPKILGDEPQLVGIVKKYVTSDIEHETDLISLARLFIGARGAPVVQVHFPANLGGPTASYVTASQGAIRAAVRKFEGLEPAATATPPQQPPPKSGGGNKKKKTKAPPKPAPPPLIDSSTSGQQFAAKLAATKTKGGKPMLDFAIYYPTKLIPGSTLSVDSRAFPIDGPGSEVYHGYKLVAAVPSQGYEAYYGVSGTDWKDPPILSNPDETKTINGQEYLLSWDGPQLRLIGWKTDHGSYWVDNTLLDVLTPGQMFAIAQSMQKYGG
jgi:polyisoprenyl-teichoic acid--peptidoglycan teichoic acid transferase